MTKQTPMPHVQKGETCNEKAALDLKVPNALTRAAMAEAEELVRAHRQRFANANALVASLEKPRSK